VVLIAVVVVCIVFGAAISYFTLKFSGTYFLIVTMAFGQLLNAVATKWTAFTGGSDGLSSHRPDLGFVSIKWNTTSLYYFVLVVFLICFILLKIIMRSSFGRTIVGVRENEGRMRALGYNTWATKYMACIIAAVFAGIAGMLYSYVYLTMTPTDLDLTTSAKPMLMVIMGGGSTLWGPSIGAFIITLFETYAGKWQPERWPLLLGLLYVVCVLFLRGGISPSLTRFYNWVGCKLFPDGKGTIKGAAPAAVTVEEESKK
jgi:branched-chain amino acid transport system permease protein